MFLDNRHIGNLSAKNGAKLSKLRCLPRVQLSGSCSEAETGMKFKEMRTFQTVARKNGDKVHGNEARSAGDE